MTENELVEMYGAVPKALVETTMGVAPIWHIDIDNLTKDEETLQKAIVTFIAGKMGTNYGQAKKLYNADALPILDSLVDCIDNVYNA